jgi:hypothetical protein
MAGMAMAAMAAMPLTIPDIPRGTIRIPDILPGTTRIPDIIQDITQDTLRIRDIIPMFVLPMPITGASMAGPTTGAAIGAGGRRPEKLFLASVTLMR